ncbi:MAG: NADH-quinone oxidoreductase subunit J [Rickettsiaceae bacterium]|nr:NADH-quinone oxidoreductase subunit J [Rickettsiaceae bacterium]
MALFFYIFSLLMITGSIFVVFAHNAVYSVLWLIFTFLSSSGLFLLLGAEFISLSIVIVYVGAIAVLFLFVVMMLGANPEKPLAQFSLFFYVSSGIVVLLAGDLYFLVTRNFPLAKHIKNMVIGLPEKNTHFIGQVLYTDFGVVFQLCGLILLVAMIGSIVLTLRTKTKTKKQNAREQLSRDPDNSVKLIKTGVKEGIDGIKYK